MKKNFPVTHREVALKPGSSIISATDLKGAITYVNHDFIEISGFTEQELLGKNHNMVRHPDMPPAAFEDLWDRVKAGRPWRGIVKNRCKNGDHYWVEAFVSPIFQKGQIIGYQSVRSQPTREQVKQAEDLYAHLNSHPTAKLPRPLRLGDIGMTKRLGFPALLAGALPVAGFSLWGADLIGNTALTTLSLTSPLILLALVLHVRQTMFKPIGRLIDIVYLMASGNLDERFDQSGEDELGRLATALRMLQARFRTVVGQMSEVSVELTANAQQISDSSSETFQVMFEQQQSTDKVNTAMLNMRESVHSVASNSDAASETADEANAAATQGQVAITKLKTTVESLVDDVEKSARVVGELEAKSQDISSILEVIRAIADQTNLLALNAAIEAARAGEQGRGFAVVADEVRTLAGRTADATGEINQVIEQLHQGIDSAVQVMNTGRQTASQATGQSGEALTDVEKILQAVERIRVMNGEIADAAKAQQALSDSISSDMASINAMAGNTLGLTQNNSEAGNQLTQVSERLIKQFKHFGMAGEITRRVEEAKQKTVAKAPTAQQEESILF